MALALAGGCPGTHELAAACWAAVQVRFMDARWEVRDSALEAGWQLLSASSRPDWGEALVARALAMVDSEQAALRARALEVLTYMAPLGAAVAAALPDLGRALRDSDDVVRRAALRMFMALDRAVLAQHLQQSPETSRLLRSLHQDADWEIKVALLDWFNELVPALPQAAAAGLVAALGGSTQLLLQLSDPDRFVRLR